MKLTVINLSVLLACACGATSPTGNDETSPTGMTAEKPVDTAEATPAEATPVEAEAEPAEGADQPAPFTITVEALNGGQSGIPSAPATLTASTKLNAIAVSFTNLPFYCDPQPSFSARDNGTVLELSVSKPDSNVSKCFGPYSGELTIYVPGRNNLRQVSLRSAEGKELATATITGTSE